MIAVANSTPLIYLAAIGQFDLLRDLFTSLLIPDAVFDEVVTQGRGRWGSTETASASWIESRPVSNRQKVNRLLHHLHLGEAEVVVLAEELPADVVVMDEAAARTELRARGLAFTGTVGVLIEGKHRGFIPEVASLLDALRRAGFHFSDRMYRHAIRLAGEPIP